jgi:hypothetical protein
MGDFDGSEQWVRRASERYEAGAFDWYFWCVRTGHGSLQEARELADNRANVLKNTADSFSVLTAAAYYIVAEKWAPALEITRKVGTQYPAYRAAALWEALLAEEVEDPKARDAALQRLAGISGPVAAAEARTKAKEKAYQRLGGLVPELLKGIEPDQKSLKEALAGLEDRDRTEAYYIVGRFLERHGKSKEALPYYKAAARFAQTNTIGALASTLRLRSLGESQGK